VVAQLEQIGKKLGLVIDSPGTGGAICAIWGMPQDVRVSPDGKLFYVADMLADGVHVVDGPSFRQIGSMSPVAAATSWPDSLMAKVAFQ
jgi:hypothetical protein